MDKEKQEEYTIDDIKETIEFYERQFDMRNDWSEHGEIQGFRDKNKKYAKYNKLAVLALKALLIMQGQELHEFDDVEITGTFTPNGEMSDCLTKVFGENWVEES